MNRLGIGKNLFIFLLLKTKENGGEKKLEDILNEFCDFVTFRDYSNNEDISKLAYKHGSSDRCIKLVDKGTLGDLLGKFDKAFVLEIDSNLCKKSMTIATDFLYYLPNIFMINKEDTNKKMVKQCSTCDYSMVYFLPEAKDNECPICKAKMTTSKNMELSEGYFNKILDCYFSNKKKYDDAIKNLNEYEKFFVDCINQHSDLEKKKHILAELLLNNDKTYDFGKSFDNINAALKFKNDYMSYKEAYFETKLYNLSKSEVSKLKDKIEYAFLVVGFKIFENEIRLEKRYKSILFTRFDHHFPPSTIYDIWNGALKDYLRENVQYIFHGFNTNEMICVLCDDTFSSLKTDVIDRILTEFNKERKLIIESTTIFCPYKNDSRKEIDELVDYLIFVKLIRDESREDREDIIEIITNEIKELKKNNFCRNKCGNGPNHCEETQDNEAIKIFTCQGFFDLSIPVRTRNPCFVSTLSSKIKKLDQVEDISTIVQITLRGGIDERCDKKK